MARKSSKKKTKKRSTKGRASTSRKNVKFEDLSFPTYEDVKEKAVKAVGEMPKRPKNFDEGSWTEQAIRVLEERYLQKDDDGVVIETPDEMCWRVAWEIASAEGVWGKKRRAVKKKAKEFYDLLISRKFLPNSPTLMNAGTGNHFQFSACFVLPVEDSLVGIFDAIKHQAIIHQSGGGTGFAFSRLRPRGAIVRSSSGVASGPVSFMRIFDAATNEVKQGGKRRGANMGILRVDHPDILEFIECKEDGGITNFNISVAVTDDFMTAYEKGEQYELINPQNDEKVGSLDAREIFDKIAQGAWSTGDPGLIFLDKINDSTANPVPSMGPVESTNPCGEQPLYPYDSCNLGSIFLSYFVKENKGKKEIDWTELKAVTQMAVEFLDNVIEMNPYPLQEIRNTSLAIRRIGLGVGGWADLLLELEIPYNSEEALKLGEKVMKTIQDEAVKATQRLAKEREPFPMYPASIYKNGKARRNSTVTTIAPTGTISIIAGTSSGIEPIFALAFQHIVKDKHLHRTLTFINPKFEEVAKEKGFWSKELKEKVAEHGHVGDIDEVPEKVREVFVTSHQIHHDWHIKMQSAFQKHTENAVSKTINMRNKVKVEDVKEAYLQAWESSCMGITVFRDGSKDAQVLNVGVKEKELHKGNGEVRDQQVIQEFTEPTIERPYVVRGATYKMRTPVGTAFITINETENGEPLEVFINVGKAGSEITAFAEALGRTISTSLRFTGNLTSKQRAKEIAEQLSGIGGRRSVGFGINKIYSLPDAIAAALSRHYGFGINGLTQLTEFKGSGAQLDSAGAVMSAQTSSATAGEMPVQGADDHTAASAQSTRARDGIVVAAGQLKLEEKRTSDICPSCGASALVYEEGCSKCYSCGHSEC